MHTLFVHLPSLRPQQNRHPTVTIPRVAQRQLPHPITQHRLPVALLLFVALSRPRLRHRPARLTLRHTQLLLNIPHRPAPLCRRQYFPPSASFKIDLSSASSATIRFKRTFSFSSMNIRLASSICTPP